MFSPGVSDVISCSSCVTSGLTSFPVPVMAAGAAVAVLDVDVILFCHSFATMLLSANLGLADFRDFRAGAAPDGTGVERTEGTGVLPVLPSSCKTKAKEL